MPYQTYQIIKNYQKQIKAKQNASEIPNKK